MICEACRLSHEAVEMPCAEHCQIAQIQERDRRFALVIDGLPCGVRRRLLQREGRWSAWGPDLRVDEAE